MPPSKSYIYVLFCNSSGSLTSSSLQIESSVAPTTCLSSNTLLITISTQNKLKSSIEKTLYTIPSYFLSVKISTTENYTVSIITSEPTMFHHNSLHIAGMYVMGDF